MTTFSATNAYTLPELQQFYDSDGKLSTIIDMLAQDNPIMQHIPWKEGNQTDGHKHKILTALPEPSFRRLYQGASYTKSGTAQVKDITRQIVDRWGIDVDELLLYDANDQGAFRVQEGLRHVEGMQQTFVKYLFYGDNNSDPDQFHGLAPRYPYKDSPNVVDAGATSGDTCSIWGIVWDPISCFAIYPKNMPAGLQHEDLGKFDAYDADDKPYRAVGDEWKWNMGLAVGDYRYVVRICNIPVDDLWKPSSDADYVDLRKLTIKAKNMIPSGARSRMQWYVPNAVMNAIEYQAGEEGNVHLRYGEYLINGIKQEVLKLHGRPTHECDALLETETALTATP